MIHGSTRRHLPPTRPPSARGQSLVEFALVLPIVLMLLLAIADFSRVFAAGIVMEASARDAAEIVAQAYLEKPPPDTSGVSAPLSDPAPAPGDDAYYEGMHELAARTVCAEARDLPATDYVAGVCATWPKVRSCIHDGVDPRCGSTPTGFSSTSPDCPSLGTAMSPTEATGAVRRFVEVRVCQRFDMILDIGFLPIGQIHLERARSFTIACYFELGTADCG